MKGVKTSQGRTRGLPMNSLPSLARFFFVSCLFLSHLHACEATIYTFSNISSSSISPQQHQQEHENDYAILRDAFPSLPGLFGGEMQDNTLYRARLQFIRDNSYLCQDEQDAESRTYHDPKMGSFVLPPDYQQAIDTANNNTNTTSPNHNFVPVALLAARGFCPFFNKAVVAESFGQAVHFLIVYNNDIDGEDVLVPMNSEYGNTRLILLSVTHRTGQALKRYIAAQSHDVIAAGGPLIEFDNLPPEGILTVQDLQNYVLSALGLFFMFVSLSGCFLIWVGRRGGGPSTRIVLVAGDMPAVATASSSSRRVLTTGQIQLLVQATRQQKQQAAANGEVDEAIGAASLTTVSAHEDDCCAVCMEDFEHDADQSEHNLTLPCGHLFHKDCVVPWLTERQAKCPLCKFDVAEYIRQYQAEQGITETDATSSAAAVALWNPLTWVRYRSWTAVAGDAAEEENYRHHHASASSTPTRTGSPVYDDEERQTVVIELAEHSGTLT